MTHPIVDPGITSMFHNFFSKFMTNYLFHFAKKGIRASRPALARINNLEASRLKHFR